jgi:hypothetical protein
MNLLGMVWFSPAQVHPVEPSDKPVEVKRKYKVRRKPKEKQKTNKKIKGKAKIREESQSSTPPAAPDDLPNTKDQVPKATRRLREETQSYDPIESTPAPAPEKQWSEQAQSAPKTSLFVDQPSNETGETKRYPTHIRKPKVKMNIAGKGVVRRGLRAVAMAVVTGTTQAFMSCGNCDTLPDSSVTSDIPLAQEMYHGRIFNPNEMEKLHELTVLDRLNEDPNFHWGIERVLEHKSKRVTRRIPKTFDKEHLVTSTKVRLKIQFFDRIWKQLELMTHSSHSSSMPRNSN